LPRAGTKACPYGTQNSALFQREHFIRAGTIRKLIYLKIIKDKLDMLRLGFGGEFDIISVLLETYIL